MSDADKWNQRYRDADIPWDTGFPSTQLQRVIREEKIAPCRALDIGCGTGSNALWLAEQRFDVTGIDLAPLALQQAEARAIAAGLKIRFLTADVTDLPDLGPPYQFFFDRGCYHAVRRTNAAGYLQSLQRCLAPGAKGLFLAGNAREPHDQGPPVVTEAELRGEWSEGFKVHWLREFRFDARPGSDESFLGWSCFVERKKLSEFPDDA